MIALRKVQMNCWRAEELPRNVRIGANTVLTKDPVADHTFHEFRSCCEPGLEIGTGGTMAGARFNIGQEGRVRVGDFCYFHEAFLLCELEITIGDHVFIGWHATLADADFHPIDPAERLVDVLACSPQGQRDNCSRPPFRKKPIRVEDGAYIGPLAIILKGVRIGAGAFIEPGAVVIHDVPAGARMMGNPAVQIGSVSA
jgi:acetyltransferase-like isoleucine patch superfamily enzyme